MLHVQGASVRLHIDAALPYEEHVDIDRDDLVMHATLVHFLRKDKLVLAERLA